MHTRYSSPVTKEKYGIAVTTDLLVRESGNDKKALISLYGTSVSELAWGQRYEQRLPFRTVSQLGPKNQTREPFNAISILLV